MLQDVLIPWLCMYYVQREFLSSLFYITNSSITNITNMTMLIPIMGILDYFDLLFYSGKYTSSYNFIIRYVSFPFVYETIFFFIHRLFHTKLFYRFHAQHHKWTIPNLESTFDCSVVEHVFLNALPVYLASYISDMNFFDVCLVWTFAVHNAYWVHTHNSNHLIHHKYKNVNYGANSYIFDLIFGTYKST